MNPKLRQLLAACSVDGDLARPIRWSDALILQNYGAIPPAVGKRGSYVLNRGFNLLLLGRGGVPRYFCKCRPTADQSLGRETAVLQALNRDPELSGVAPPTRGARSEELQLQVSEFVPGQSYAFRVPRLRESQWAASMRDILTLARRVSTRVAALLPDFLAGTGPVVLHEVAAGSLTELTAAGLGDDQLRALDTAIRRAGALPRLLQHGDLWPANVLWHQGAWRLLDFESFGRVQVPLYDVFHFVRTCWSLRQPRLEAAGVWIDSLASNDREAALCRYTIRRETSEFGLDAPQAIGVLLYYLVDVTARFIRRLPRPFWEPLALEVQRAADRLNAGVPLEEVVLGRT